MYRPYKLKVYGDVCTRNNDEVQFSTIASFKGLESKVILIVDVDRMDDSFSRLLHYVAVSRARSNLYFFYDKAVEDLRQQMILKAYTGMKKRLFIFERAIILYSSNWSDDVSYLKFSVEKEGKFIKKIDLDFCP